MLEKVIVGILIGFASGYFLSQRKEKQHPSGLGLVFIAIISIGFIASSFMYGAVYGLMAIGEIGIGYVFATNMFDKNGEV